MTKIEKEIIETLTSIPKDYGYNPGLNTAWDKGAKNLIRQGRVERIAGWFFLIGTRA